MRVFPIEDYDGRTIPLPDAIPKTGQCPSGWMQSGN